MPRNINDRTAGTRNPENRHTRFCQKCEKEPPFWRNSEKNQTLQRNEKDSRTTQAPGGDEASGLHAPKRGRTLLPLTAAALPTRWDPPGRRPERRRKPGGRRLACTEDGWNQCACQLPPLPSLAFSPCVLLITRDVLPLFVLSFLLSLRLLSHYSPHPVPAAFFLLLGTPAHPAVMFVLISPTWPCPRPSILFVLMLWTLHCA